MQNKLFVVGNTDQKFSEDSYGLAILQTLPMIDREPGSVTRYVMEQFISQNKLVVRKKMKLTSNEAVKQAVLAG